MACSGRQSPPLKPALYFREVLNMSIFLQKNQRDPLCAVDMFTKHSTPVCPEGRSDVWATVHVDMFDDRFGVSSEIQEGEAVECFIIPKKELERLGVEI